MNYLHTMVRIADIDQSLAFYCGLRGMVEVRRIENRGGRFTLIFLAAKDDEPVGRGTGAPLLELTYNWPPAEGESERPKQEGRSFGHLAFAVDDIYAVCDRLNKGGVPISRPPRDGHMAFVKSPDGISIELLQKGPPLAPVEQWATAPNIGSW